MKKCPNCGNLTDSKFCPDCGFDLSDVEIFDQKEEVFVPAAVVEEDKDSEATSESTSGITIMETAANNDEMKESAVDSVAADGITKDHAAVDKDDNTREISPAVQTPNNDNKKGNKKKIGLIVGGILAAIVLIAIVVISNQPKLVSIDAKYSGPTEKGTLIDGNSNITVTGTFDDNSTKDITGWSVEETTIAPGYNDITVTYQDQNASISVYSPLMSGGQYVASVDEIKDVLYSYNSKYVDGFSGFSKDTEVGGKYNYDGSVLDLSVSFTKKSGSENVDVDGGEVPNAVIVTMMLKSDDFGANLDRVLSAGAAAFTAVDPEINYDDAYSQIKTCTSDTVDKAEGAVASDEKSLDNLNIGTGMVLANGNLLIFYSFKSK